MIFPEDVEERALFHARLLETAHWCREHLRVEDPAGSLRSGFLKPSLVILEEQNQGRWNYGIADPILEVSELCRKRANMITARTASEFIDPMADGRLLRFYPYETLCDGAAWQSSNGFFDKWNIPPWDTWMWYARLPDDRVALYSWVPRQFIKLAAAGVSVNPEQSIDWIEN